jgi:hypothetical protein
VEILLLFQAVQPLLIVELPQDLVELQMLNNGIQFPATQVASADANNLDDYEEGTFTPTFTSTSASFSYSQQHGFYTKIGRSVTCHIFIRAQSSGTTSNALKITGLPFTSLNSSGLYASVSFGQIESVDYPAGALEISGHVASNATQIDLQNSKDDQGAVNLLASAIDGATSITAQIENYNKATTISFVRLGDT